MSTSNARCAACGKSFKRLQSHPAHFLACKLHYMSCFNAAATVAPTIQNSADVNTTNVLQGKNHCTFPSLRTWLCESSAKVREAGDTLHHVKDLNVVSTSSGDLSSGMVAFASSWCIAHCNQNRSQNLMQVLFRQECNIQVSRISMQFMYTFCNRKNKLWTMHMALYQM